MPADGSRGVGGASAAGRAAGIPQRPNRNHVGSISHWRPPSEEVARWAWPIIGLRRRTTDDGRVANSTDRGQEGFIRDRLVLSQRGASHHAKP
jgi:hypothetical protein